MKLSEFLALNPELDHDIEIEDDDIVSDIVVGMRAVRLTDTDDALLLSASDHTTGIVQYGIVCTAKLQLDDWMQNGSEA